VLALGWALHAAPALAHQQPDDAAWESLVREQYQRIDASVVQIRTTAQLEYEYLDPRSGLRSLIRRPLSATGTGVVIGRIEVDGRWEYLIMTNHHVADMSNYVIQDGPYLRENRHNTLAVPSVPEESFLIGEDGQADIELIEVVRDVRGDMTVFRTIGADRELAKFPYHIGYQARRIRPGDRVVTSGFPSGGGKVLETGTVLEVDRLHELGLPHHDFIIDIPVEHGQSGSPLFLVEVEDTDGGPAARFTLIGLLHASENGETFVVPFELWADSLLEEPGTTLERIVR
jgi:S1-C subfamily serine protease